MVVAKSMLAHVKSLPEGTDKEELLEHWEKTLKRLKEEERKTLPVSMQLKSALDRVEGKKKAMQSADNALVEAQEALVRATKEQEEMKQAFLAEEAELKRLQSEAAEEGEMMAVDSEREKSGLLEKTVAELQVQNQGLQEILKKVVVMLPQGETLVTQVQELLQQPTTQQVQTAAPVVGTGKGGAESFRKSPAYLAERANPYPVGAKGDSSGGAKGAGAAASAAAAKQADPAQPSDA